MNFQDYLYASGAVLTALGGGAALIFGFSSWLGKVWANRILETEKAELNRLGIENQIRFSKLHEKQALLIAELYEKLRALDYGVRQVSYWIAHTPMNKEWIAKASLKLTNDYVAAREHFERHQIYLSPTVCDKVREVIALSASVSDEYFVSIITEEEEERLKQAQALARNIVDEKAGLISESLTLIEDEFRILLGVTKSSK